MCYNQTGDISTLEGTPLKLVDKFTYLGSSVESTEKDIETRLTKAWTAINRLSTIWKSDLTDKMKRSFFQAAVTSILLYGCTTWTLTKRLEKKLDGDYTRMLRAILNKSWRHNNRFREGAAKVGFYQFQLLSLDGDVMLNIWFSRCWLMHHFCLFCADGQVKIVTDH